MPALIAALPMYDWAVVRAETDRFWALIRDHLRQDGISAPETLTRGADLWAEWLSPDLLLSQTCGLPFRTGLLGRVTYVGTLDYGIEGAPPCHYRSHVVARADDRRPLEQLARRFACNGFDSQSGWGGPAEWLRGQGIALEAAIETGAHRASAERVADGSADLAGIDAVTWRHLLRELPGVAAGLRIVATTPPTPSQPIITALGRDPEPLRRAVSAAVSALSAADRTALGIAGFGQVSLSAYTAVPTPEAPELPFAPL